MRKRYGRKTDANQRDIVSALRAIGAQVWVIEEPVDLLVAYRNRWYILECKNRDGKNRLTDAQREFLETVRAPVGIVHDAESAIAFVSNRGV